MNNGIKSDREHIEGAFEAAGMAWFHKINRAVSRSYGGIK